MEALNEVLGSQQHVLLGILAAQILPMIVGLVSDETAGATKTWLLMILTAVTTVVDEVIAAGTFEWDDLIIRFFVLFAAAVISYKGWQARTIGPKIQAAGGHLSVFDVTTVPPRRP